MSKWVSRIFKYLRQTFIGLLVLTVAYYGSRYAVQRIKKLLAPASPSAHQQPELSFSDKDSIQFRPVANGVTDLNSDKTTEAVLRGVFGPVVVMIYAEWCVHCKNMMAAFEEAAKQAKTPFVRAQGQFVPVAARRHNVSGYPTVLGVASDGTVARFNDERTVSKLLAFSNGLRAEVPTPDPSKIMEPAAPLAAAPPLAAAAPPSAAVAAPESVDVVNDYIVVANPFLEPTTVVTETLAPRLVPA